MTKSEMYAAYLQKYDAFLSKQKRVRELEETQRKVQKERDEQLKGLKAAGMEEEKRLNEQRRRQLEGLEGNRSRYQEQLKAAGKRNLTQAVKEYDEAIQAARSHLNGLEERCRKQVEEELSYVGNSRQALSLAGRLQGKAKIGSLPESLGKVLQEPVGKVASRLAGDGRSGITWEVTGCGKRIAGLPEELPEAGLLEVYVPGWWTMTGTLLLSILVGVLPVLILFLCDLHIPYLSDVLNLIVNYGLRLAGAGAAGALLFLAVKKRKDKAMGYLAGAVGAVVAFLLLLQWSVVLPEELVAAVDAILKIFPGMLAAFLTWTLVRHNGKAAAAVRRAGLTIPYVRKEAAQEQDKAIRPWADLFYALVRYRELIPYLAETKKNREEAYYTRQLQTAQWMKQNEMTALEQKRNQDLEANRIGLEETEEELRKADAGFQRKQAGLKAQQERQLQEYCRETELRLGEISRELSRRKREIPSDLEELEKLYWQINNTSVSHEETKGILSDSLYLFEKDNGNPPRRCCEIRHEKKPLVFLYDVKDSTNVAAALFPFVIELLGGIYAVNSVGCFDVTIVDPVSKGRKFEAKSEFVRIENNIGKLSARIQESMRAAAGKGMHIDAYNLKMYRDMEDMVKFLKYRIVIFLVPEESSAQKTDFFDSDLWGTLGDGGENGFLPIFFINLRDWQAVLRQEGRSGSGFIQYLRKAIGRTNGSVYEINTERIAVKRIRA